jgi:hypothetical protein
MSTISCHPVLGPALSSSQAPAADAVGVIDLAVPARVSSRTGAIARFFATLATDVQRSRRQARARFPLVRGN